MIGDSIKDELYIKGAGILANDEILQESNEGNISVNILYPYNFNMF